MGKGTTRQTAAERTRRDRTILVVDDDGDVRDSLLGVLEAGLDDARILTAGSAKEALEVLDAGPVDLILTDYQMPDVDGLTFLKEFRKGRPDVPCILMTAYPAMGLAVKAVDEAHIDGFAVKPLERAKVVNLVRRALDHKEGFDYQTPG